MKKTLTLLFALFLSTALALAAPKNIRVLAIGNSFSEDAIEQNLYELARADGRTIIIGNLYIPGCSLERHLQNAQTDAPAYRYRKITADGQMIQVDNVSLKDALQDEQWDFISMQQASHFSGLYSTYTPFLPQLIAYVQSLMPRKAKLLWHQTWAYAADAQHDGFRNYGRDQLLMYRAISACSQEVMTDYGFERVVPCGTAIQNARTSIIGDHMNRDGYHLELSYGRYTAACTWYETIFRRSCVGNAYAPEGLTPDYKEVAQKAAHSAVKHPYRITAQ